MSRHKWGGFLPLRSEDAYIPYIFPICRHIWIHAYICVLAIFGFLTYFQWQIYFYSLVFCLVQTWSSASEVNAGKQCFYTLSETGTWNNGIFPSITPGLAVTVRRRGPSLAGLGK